MIKTVDSRENKAAQLLLRVIPNQLNPRADFDVVRVSYGASTWAFLPIWVGEGLPADAKRGQSELDRVSNLRPFEIPVVLARRISPGAREILENADCSWADASGRAHIEVPGHLYITRLDPIPADRPRSFAWTAAASAIAETLLTWRVRQGLDANAAIDRVTEIAPVADVSLAHTARVLRQFDELRYTFKTGAERGTSATRELRDPGRMLSDWAAHNGYQEGSGALAEFHVPWRDTEESVSTLVNALAEWDWAVTGGVAADRIAPFVTNVSTLDIYVPASHFRAMVDRLAKEPNVTPVDSGGRIRLLAAEPYMFHLADEVRGVRTAPSVRVYADLLRQGARSAEAAEHLREVAIGF